ncbi:MAG: alpha/beta hydrolase [Dehalococcoidales bacterium]|nr:alpha/beta hydrolase [Dehalococcoidales bacterium]
MKESTIATGFSKNGLPYLRIGGGAGNLVIFEGLSFDHDPPVGMQKRMIASGYRDFSSQFTVYYLGRKPHLPQGYSIKDMADDYAAMVEAEMEPPVDIMGLSTGGAIAQQFAVDHPGLVRKLVLASAGYKLSVTGAAAQRKMIDCVRQGKWRAGAAALGGVMASGMARPLSIALLWLMGGMMFKSANGPSDGLVELEAEDKFNFKERLPELKMPVLVIGGENDRFYPVAETGDMIPSARVIIYPHAGHMVAMKKQFNREILAFLIDCSV